MCVLASLEYLAILCCAAASLLSLRRLRRAHMQSGTFPASQEQYVVWMPFLMPSMARMNDRQRDSSPELAEWMSSVCPWTLRGCFLGDARNYDSTAIRLPFDCSSTTRRHALPQGCCTAAWINKHASVTVASGLRHCDYVTVTLTTSDKPSNGRRIVVESQL